MFELAKVYETAKKLYDAYRAERKARSFKMVVPV